MLKISKQNTLYLSKVAITIVTLLSVLNKNANAGGYSTFLHSTSGLGNSYAGSSTGSHDISDIYFNPSITSENKKKEAIFSLNYIDLRIDPDFNNAKNALGNQNGPDVHNAGSKKFIPALYLSSPINDKTAINFAVTTPFGLETNYEQGWTGSFRALKSTIKTINLNPSIAYNLNNSLSIGGGLVAQYYYAKLSKKSFNGTNTGIGTMEGSDWGYGYNLGANYKINDNTKFGIGYRSAIRYNIRGNVGFDNTKTRFNSTTTTPESLSVGLSHQYSDKLQVVADSIWTRWSRLKQLRVDAQIPKLSSTSYFNWNDSFLNSLGANYKIDSNNLIRGGLAYEIEAINNRNREARVPPSDKYWVSLGLNHKLHNDFEIDFSLVRQIYKSSRINISSQGENGIEGTLSGKYNTSVNVVSFALKKQF